MPSLSVSHNTRPRLSRRRNHPPSEPTPKPVTAISLSIACSARSVPPFSSLHLSCARIHTHTCLGSRSTPTTVLANTDRFLRQSRDCGWTRDQSSDSRPSTSASALDSGLCAVVARPQHRRRPSGGGRGIEATSIGLCSLRSDAWAFPDGPIQQAGGVETENRTGLAHRRAVDQAPPWKTGRLAVRNISHRSCCVLFLPATRNILAYSWWKGCVCWRPGKNQRYPQWGAKGEFLTLLVWRVRRWW